MPPSRRLRGNQHKAVTCYTNISHDHDIVSAKIDTVMRLTMNSAPIRQSLARLALRRQPIHSSRRFSSSDARQDKTQDTLATAQKFSTKVFENVKKFLEPVGEYTGRLFGCVFLFFSFLSLLYLLC